MRSMYAGVVTLLLLLPFCVHGQDMVMHPLALETVQSSLADTEILEYPQISITAIRANRNRYPFDALTYDGKWVKYVTDQVSLKYSIESLPDDRVLFHFWANYGGSLSNYTGFLGQMTTKTLRIDEREQTIEIFDILEIHTRPAQ